MNTSGVYVIKDALCNFRKVEFSVIPRGQLAYAILGLQCTSVWLENLWKDSKSKFCSNYMIFGL